MISIRNDKLKNAFENGLKSELLQGYENRIPADADYNTAVTTATDIESILARKKTSKSRNSELSAISLHQELLTSDVEELKRKFEGLHFSDNLQVRPRTKEIASVATTPSDNRPYTGTPNFTTNSRAIKLSGNTNSNDRSRQNTKRPRSNNERSPSPYVKRSRSPYNRRVNFDRSPSPYPRERSVSRDRSQNDLSIQNPRPTTPTRIIRSPHNTVRPNFPYNRPSNNFRSTFNQVTPFTNTFRSRNLSQPPRCYNCGRIGHTRPQCLLLSSPRRNTTN